MARLMTVGFDAFYGTDAFPSYEYDWTGAGADILQETTSQRSGPSCIKVDSTGTNSLGNLFTAWGSLGANGYYVRIYMRFGALPASTVRVMQMDDSAGSPAALVSAKLTAAGKLQLWNQTGTPAQIGSDSAATIKINTWYRVELHCKTVTGASDTAALRLDGVEIASATGLALSDVNVGGVRYGIMDAVGASRVFMYDDMAVNDDTGSNQTSWPGDGTVAYSRPLSDNARGANWTAGAGGTTNLWDAVNADTPAGVAFASATNTSQIKNTNTADTTGNYDANMESYTTAGVGATDTIVLVQSVTQVGSTGEDITGAVQIVSNPAQSSEESKSMGAGSAMGSYGTAWESVWGAAQYAPVVVFGTQPVLRIGRRGTQPQELHCCGMRIAIEYVAVGSLVGAFTDHPKPVLRGATL